METTVHRAYPATRLACIVNLLHRMALGMPQETFRGLLSTCRR